MDIPSIMIIMSLIDFSSRKTKIILGIGMLLLVLLLAFFLHRLYVRHFIKLPNYQSLQEKRPLAPEDIQGWMTFEYINFVFKLPPDYLRQELSIESDQYPKTTLKKYASKAGVKASLLIENVQEAVRQYKP